MSFLQRAFCYISRKRLKSLLLFLIFTVINCMLLGILGIRKVSEEVMKELRSNTDSKVILEIREKMEQFTKNDVQEISKISNINWMNCLRVEQMEISGLAPIIVEEQSEQLFTVHMQDRVDKDSPFEEKIYRLVEGDFPSGSNEIVINQTLADQNGLRIGDCVSENYKIAGIFLSGTERQQTKKVATVNRIENQIYIQADNNLSKDKKDFTKIVCYAKEPKKLDTLAEALEKKYVKKAYVRADDHDYQKMKISMEQTGRVTLFVLIITLITGCLVIGLLLSMWMRGRKTEIAVYVSLGIEKRKILLQAIVEGLLLYSISFGLSELFSVGFMPIAGRGLKILESAGKSLKIDGTVSLMTLACGMCVIILLTTIAMFPYLKKHPKEILSEMEG